MATAATLAERGRPGTRRWLLPAATVAFLAVLAMGGRWWLGSAEAFAEGGAAGSVSGIPIGETSSWTVTSGVPDVTVTDYEVVLADGTGAAATGASVCWGASGFGGVRGDLGSLCPGGLLSLDGADLSAVPDDASLVLSAAPLSASPVEVVGLRIAFDEGMRTGEQVLPVRLLVVPEG